jgi:hypothetical protein
MKKIKKIKKYEKIKKIFLFLNIRCDVLIN